MASILTQAVGAILDNYADVIEGGNSYNSGTSYKGIPGTQSHDRAIDEVGTVTASGNGTTTTITYANSLADTARYYRADGPPFFLRCTSSAGAGSADNADGARKVSNWSATTITTAAWPDGTLSGDAFVMMEGFKRAPDSFDIESDGPDTGFDRFFHLRLVPGALLPWSGANTKTYRGILELRLRIE